MKVDHAPAGVRVHESTCAAKALPLSRPWLLEILSGEYNAHAGNLRNTEASYLGSTAGHILSAGDDLLHEGSGPEDVGHQPQLVRFHGRDASPTKQQLIGLRHRRNQSSLLALLLAFLSLFARC